METERPHRELIKHLRPILHENPDACRDVCLALLFAFINETMAARGLLQYRVENGMCRVYPTVGQNSDCVFAYMASRECVDTLLESMGITPDRLRWTAEGMRSLRPNADGEYDDGE